MLYPLKFTPILKERIWGGQKLKTVLNKNIGKIQNCGESWEISAIQKNISKVSNGFLKGNNLEELIEIYMGDLVGDKVYQQFGIEFPLLIKFIDATDVLSIQVHPNDKLAMERHQAYGKTEMWYVIEAENNAELITGFKRDVDKETYLHYFQNNKITEILNTEKVKTDDVYFLPAGRIHAIGAGILLAEIQQTSDITYRIFDWNRTDDKGNPRELHTELATDAIDYTKYESYNTLYQTTANKTNKIISCRYFTTNIINFSVNIEKDYSHLDSFVIYMCLEGKFKIQCKEAETIEVTKGETVLIPAALTELVLNPEQTTKILEVYI